jgi:carbamoyl-phosphate synthase small subunit
LSEYLSSHSVVGIADIDTRKLTRLLREKGAQNGSIVAGDDIDDAQAMAAARAFPGLKGMDLAREVTTAEPYVWRNGGWGSDRNAYRDASAVRFNVIAYDFGVKQNILRMLVDRGCAVQVVPASTTAEQVLAQHADGVFLSNGPGDPEACDYAIAAIRGILDANVPVFGICLGHQLLSLASGANTIKMKFGHHGANHPVQDLQTGQVFITSQNHGFAVDAEGVPDHLQITHTSLFDGSVQGVARTDRPAFSFQGHPEASPGPHDISLLFDRFVDLMAAHRGSEPRTTKALGSHA